MQGVEHAELGWFSPRAAALLPDLALVEYRPLLGTLADDRLLAAAQPERLPL